MPSVFFVPGTAPIENVHVVDPFCWRHPFEVGEVLNVPSTVAPSLIWIDCVDGEM